ncbi:MAG: sigma-70 family RNA polymerase sigma factor [Fuerstiella sp.]
MTDGDLVRQATDGRSAAYGELVQRWSAQVLAMCHARVGRHAIAEELAQETLLRGFRSLGSIEAPDRFGSWICGIAHHVCMDHRKAKQSSQVSFSAIEGAPPAELFAATNDSVIATVQQQEERAQLLREVDRLPDELRETLILYYCDDVTYQELAEQLMVSPATINARLTKARALLRQRLLTSGDSDEL